jgi:hypothetical protein
MATPVDDSTAVGAAAARNPGGVDDVSNTLRAKFCDTFWT